MPSDDTPVSKLKTALGRVAASADRRFSRGSTRVDTSSDASGIEIAYETSHRPSGVTARAGSQGFQAASRSGGVLERGGDARPMVRDRTVLWYAALAALAIVPGLALGSTVDLDQLRRSMLNITFGSGQRFWAGVLGTAILAILLLYPLRKMLSQYVNVGAVGAWFRVHLIFGILGPILILYHANFRLALRDINANVALMTMLIVLISGFIGHLVYTRASVDLYSAREDLNKRLQALLVELRALDLPEADIEAVAQSLGAFEHAIPTARHGVVQSLRNALQYETHHQRVYRQISKLLSEARDRYSWPAQEYQRVRLLIGGHLGKSAKITRSASMRSIGEQLWSRWRLLHLPLFLVMTFATTMHVWNVWDKNAFRGSRAAVTSPAAPNTPGVASVLYTPDDAVNALRRWDETTRLLTSGQEFFANASFVGSASCKGCHEKQFAEWAETWHAKMYRTVNDPAAKPADRLVVGAFDGAAIKFNNVRVPTEDGKEQGAVSFEVVPATVHPQTGAAGYFFTVRDPSTPADAQTFQVSIVIGGNWEQMYHVKVGDSYFAAPLRWKVGPPGTGAWQVDGTAQPANWIYFRGAGTTNGKPRSAAQLPFDRHADGQCVGCHTTGYRFERLPGSKNSKFVMVGNSVGNGVDNNGVMATARPGPPGTAAEMGIGCESCHGPGSAHNAAQSDPGGGIPQTPKPLVAGKTVHPLKHMTSLQQSMMCGTCHSRGNNDLSPATRATPDRAANALGFADVTSAAGDKGFLPGDTDLAARIKIFAGFGQTPQSFWPNDWAKQGRMQWQDHIKSGHHTAGAASCLTCHSGHAPLDKRVDNDRFQLRQSRVVHAGLATPAQENQCESCHKTSGSTMQPNKEMFDGSVMHAAGVTCINCHMTQVGNRIGRTTKTPPKGAKSADVFDTSDANYGKHWDVSSHLARVAPTAEGSSVAKGIAMRSSCVGCHGPDARQPIGTEQSDQKLEELAACRKQFVRDRLDLLQSGLAAAEKQAGRLLAKARAEIQFVVADRSWGAHNWDKTLRTLQAAAEDIGASCGSSNASCQISRLVTVNTQECSVRRPAVLAPTLLAPGPALVAPVSAVPPSMQSPVAAPKVATAPVIVAPPAPQPAPVTVPAPAAQPSVVLPPQQPAAPATAPQVKAPSPAATVPAQPSVPQPPLAPPAPAPQVAAPAATTLPAPALPKTAVVVPPAPPASAAPPAQPPPPSPLAGLAPLTVFSDCPTCPDMIVTPAGTFTMGSPATERGRGASEGPQRPITLTKPFAAARFSVTVEQFEEFVRASGYAPSGTCRMAEANKWWVDRADLNYKAPGFTQTPRHPVVCVTFGDAAAYISWLSKKTGMPYRLLSEAEREYVTRAGSVTAYWWGDLFDPRAATYDTSPRTPAAQPQPTNLKRPIQTPAGGARMVESFRQNPWGFFQVHGNVAEWTQDCWNKTLAGLPNTSAAVATGDCTQRALRGGGWTYWPEELRSAYREPANGSFRYTHVGFRVARDLD
jgi:formylglycine-generating enzyme required for sulfatase activity